MPWPFRKRSAETSRYALAEAKPKPKRSLLSRSLAAMFKSAQASANDNWTGTPTSIDAFIQMHHQRLVARSREQWSNNDYVRNFIRLVRQNVVGPNGITMQSKAEKPRGGLDKEACAAIEADWAEWCKAGFCEVTGQLTWREVCALAVETTARDGEFIARRIYGDDAGPHGYALQLIDPQRLPVWHENGRADKNGNFIRHGIEFNRYGRRIAYHFSSTDEGDAAYYTYSGRGFVRVPAEEIIHIFVHEVVGQKRGLPWASTSLFRLHHLEGFENAAVQNARAGASKMGFFEYEDGFGPEMDDGDALTIDAEPLSFHELPEGARFKEFNPEYPSGEFATFHKAMLRGASAGMGVLYNNVAGDLEGVNFSSIRQGTLDEREHYKELQQWLIDALVIGVFEDHLSYRLLSGGIKTKGGRPLPAAKIETYKKVAWQPRRWQWIDPRADVDGAIDSIRAGLNSPSQVIREQGRDPETVFAEFAEDLKAMEAAGIPKDIIMAFMFSKPPVPAAQPAKNNEGQ
jgi:lambda family phage portal protein